jgi:antitoxin component YwqK of YwqJK toxin-antitoxin module
MQIISVLNFELIVELFSESFSPMDVLFYGIAIYQGYKFSFRTFSDELLQEIAEGRVPRSPFEKYRIPIASTLFIGLLVISYFITSANSGMRTNYYESGAKLSSGEISGGKETGVWEFYDESGNIVSKGNFTEGKQDGTWEFFDESGVRYRRGTFSKNIAHGEWIDYHKNGKVASTGNYTNGRQTGPWVYYYENGNVMRKGEMKMDKMHGEWETYHENGKLNSRLNYFRAEPVGNATHWNEDGEKVRESVYKDGIETIINLWDSVGKPQIVNGSGTYTGVYDDGSIREKGQYHNGYKTGIWDSYYPNGERQETGEFRNGVYFLQQSWSPSGIEDVKQGSGESGRIQDGLRVGVWSKYLPDGVTVWSEYNYVQGKLEGKNTIFFSDGTVNVEGIMKADKQDGEWIWYYENGNVETRATFRNGIKEGDQIFYTDAGDHIRTEQYKDGECVKVVIDEEL